MTVSALFQEEEDIMEMERIQFPAIHRRSNKDRSSLGSNGTPDATDSPYVPFDKGIGTIDVLLRKASIQAFTMIYVTICVYTFLQLLIFLSFRV